MQKVILFLFCAVMAAAMTGCAHTYANVSTQQDPKFPITLQDKIALAHPDATTEDVGNRVAAENLAEQLRFLGYNLVPEADADLLLHYNVSTKDIPITYGTTVPTSTGVMGDVYGRPIVGAGFGEIVIPQTRIANMTDLDVTLQRLHDPKVQIWKGHIQTETGDMQQFYTQFFRSLLAHIGTTVNGTAQLDGAPNPAAPPKKGN